MNEKQKTIIENYLQACNRFDVESIVSHVHENIILQQKINGVAPVEVSGKADFTAQSEMVKALFEARTMTPTSWEFDGNTVTVDVDFEATAAVPMSETLQVGDVISLKIQLVVEFDDDKFIKLTYQV